MKFKDIKIDDTVYVQETVRVSVFGQRYVFWVPKKVERITTTQFIAGGNRYKKDNGLMIGKYREACRLGDKYGWDDKVVDQTKDMLATKKRVSASNTIEDIAEKLKNVKFDHPEIMDIYDGLKKIEEFLS